MGEERDTEPPDMKPLHLFCLSVHPLHRESNHFFPAYGYRSMRGADITPLTGFVRSPNQLLRPTANLLQLVDNAMTIGSIALVIEQALSPDSRHLLL